MFTFTRTPPARIRSTESPRSIASGNALRAARSGLAPTVSARGPRELPRP